MSVIIPTIGRSDLRACVQSVLDQGCDRLEIIVVLSGAQPGMALDLTGMPVRLINEAAAGVSRARNAGVAVAQGEIIACLDDDVIAAPGWAHAILEGFTAPEIVCVAGRVIPDGTPYHGPERYVGDRMMSRWELSRRNPEWVVNALNGETGFGCNMSFRRWFVQHTLFPIGLGAGSRVGSADEPYMFFEVIRQGYVLIHTPDAVVTHRFGNDYDVRRRLRAMLSGALAFHLAMIWLYPEQRWDFFRELWRRLLRGVRMAVRRKERNVVTTFSVGEWMALTVQGIRCFWDSRKTFVHSLSEKIPAATPQNQQTPTGSRKELDVSSNSIH